MSDTVFTDGVTLTAADWFNDINDFFYTAMGGVAGAGTITQVKFPATQVASADANTLDDYEEGSWSPLIQGTSVAGTQTYASTPVGRYTKVGNMVFITCYIQMSAKGGTTSGNIRIVGLPFTAANVTNLSQPLAVGLWKFDLDANYTFVGAQTVPNTTQIELVLSGDNQAVKNLDDTNLLATSTISISGCFRV
jgi:hypothetical protein